jgi:hypothetical protein
MRVLRHGDLRLEAATQDYPHLARNLPGYLEEKVRSNPTAEVEEGSLA